MFKNLLLATAVLLLTFSTAPAQRTVDDSRVEFDLRYWVSDLAARARVSGGLLEGTDFNVKDELGLDDRNFPSFHFSGRVAPSHKIRFEYFQVAYSGDTQLSRTINFEGQQYSVDTRVVSDFDLKQLRAGYSWQFVKTDRVRFGPLIELRGLWLDASLQAPSEGVSESSDFQVPMPAFGADLDAVAHERVQMYATVSGIPGNRFGHLFDADFGLKIFPLSNVGISVGYRYLDVKGKDDGDFATVKIKGPAVGASFRF